LHGQYIPLAVSGDRANHVCAFARSHAQEEAIVAVPRFLSPLIKSGVPVGPATWGEDVIVLPTGANGRVYRNLFTGAIIETTDTRQGHRGLPLAAVFAGFPVAMLERVTGA
jgi:(1->4)-alpha-D-glucan 1-alpha-D-glucosylmutase